MPPLCMDNKFLYPITERTFRKYVKSIFTPIKRGECVATIWIPMSGRRKHNKFLIENIHLFEEELPNFDKYILVYVEPLDITEESTSGYIRLMARSFISASQRNRTIRFETKSTMKIFGNPEATYSELLAELRNVLKDVTSRGINVIFFIGEFDELAFANTVFYKNLMGLWNDLNPNLHYVFLMRESIDNQQNLQIWGELSGLILDNVIYIPTLGGEDDEYIINRTKNQFSLELTTRQIEIVKEICGGHPYLLKEAVQILADHLEKNLTDDEIRDLFYDNFELRWVIRKVFNIRSLDEKNILSKIALRENYSKDENKDTLDFLKRMEIIKVIRGELRPFNKLFSRTIQGFERGTEILKKEKEYSDIKLDNVAGAILYKGRTVEEKFTRQEYLVLSEFIKVPNILVTRDNVGEVLWGKEMYEKYSDWALDQLISKLRKKLLALGIKDKIVTIRGRGYKFVQS